MPLTEPSNPAVWLLASIAVAVIVSNLAWMVIGRFALHTPGRPDTLDPLRWLLQALFKLAVPFLAIRAGVLSLREFGLTEIDWRVSLSSGTALAAIIVTGLGFGWWRYRRSHSDAAAAPSSFVSASRAAIDALLDQWHWSFYRAATAAWLVLSATDVPKTGLLAGPIADLVRHPIYWGVWLGMLAAGLEAMSNPFNRAALRSPGGGTNVIRRTALAVATTALFVLTQNLWLCLLVHVSVETLVSAWLPLPAEPTRATRA